jgi:hypothetical protein
MIVAQKHTRSPISIDLPDPPESRSPFDDPFTNNHAPRGNDRDASGPSSKEAEAGIGEGAWEWEEPGMGSGTNGGSELPTYAHSQSGHGRHSGAFEDDANASIEALVRRMP